MTNEHNTPPAAAPAPAEPFGYFRAEPFGWTDCAATDEGAIALYERPAAPAVPQGEPLGYINAGHLHEMQSGRVPYVYVYAAPGAGAEVPVYTTPSQEPDVPQGEPFGYFRAGPFGCTDCAADDEGAVAFYKAPPDVASLRKELEGANDFIKSLADVCQKYEELLGYRKTNAPEGASELAEAKGESSLNTELDLACANSTCQHDFALDPKSSIRICLKCGTPERRAIKPTPAAPSQPVTLTNGLIEKGAMTGMVDAQIDAIITALREKGKA